MSLLFSLTFIFSLAVLGGSLPLISKHIQRGMASLLVFTGSFLLGVTLVDLIPSVFHELGASAGIGILIGYFVQLMLQLLSHGMEHSHLPAREMSHGMLGSLLFGLSLHAFLEGIPLGYPYHSEAVLPALTAGVAFHKIPEAITLMSVMMLRPMRRLVQWAVLLGFAMLTPIAALLSATTERQWASALPIMPWIIAGVSGSFLHISTTILFESGSQRHQFSMWKWLALLLGFVLALASLLLE
ncbi:MAG: ZIP family metal transporter [Thermoflavifilum aggregans]|nr:ZIP family metal transporter [Thermoflavifilum aggregans]